MGNGFATETLQAVIHFGFETKKLYRIEAGCAVNNIAYIKVLKKTGMTREGRGRQVLPLNMGGRIVMNIPFLRLMKGKQGNIYKNNFYTLK